MVWSMVQVILTLEFGDVSFVQFLFLDLGKRSIGWWTSWNIPIEQVVVSYSLADLYDKNWKINTSSTGLDEGSHLVGRYFHPLHQNHKFDLFFSLLFSWLWRWLWKRRGNDTAGMDQEKTTRMDNDSSTALCCPSFVLQYFNSTQSFASWFSFLTCYYLRTIIK